MNTPAMQRHGHSPRAFEFLAHVLAGAPGFHHDPSAQLWLGGEGADRSVKFPIEEAWSFVAVGLALVGSDPDSPGSCSWI